MKNQPSTVRQYRGRENHARQNQANQSSSDRDFQSLRQIIDELVRRAEEKRRWHPETKSQLRTIKRSPPAQPELQMRFDFDAARIARTGSQRPATGVSIDVNETADEWFARNFPE